MEEGLRKALEMAGKMDEFIAGLKLGGLFEVPPEVLLPSVAMLLERYAAYNNRDVIEIGDLLNIAIKEVNAELGPFGGEIDDKTN